jgi:non-reducing end alpha-L-arabinofuranosidase
MKKKRDFVAVIALVFLLPIAIMMLSMSGTDRNEVSLQREGPCDIYGAAGTPCVAAHSTTRALYASYNGPLYQVKRQSDGKTLDIGLIKTEPNNSGGYADAAAQDSFCSNTVCWITIVYDQSGKGNHLMQVPPGTFKGPAKGGFNTLPIADMAPVTISGHKVYGVYVMPGMGLRNNNANDLAINDEAEGIYYVINGKHYDSGCCFDYGNSSTNGRAVGTGTMETTYYGTATAWGSGNGPGPWIMSDMEAGLFSGYHAKQNDVPSIDSWQFVTAMVNGGGGNKWDLRGGNAQEGELTVFYRGVRPGTPGSSDYFPMNKKGGILLGNGGDNGNGSAGTFYEGVMTDGYPTDAAINAVQANIVAAKYDVQSVGMSRVTTFSPNSVQNVTETFTNTTGELVQDVKMSLLVPDGWKAACSGSVSTTFAGPVQPGASVSAVFTITSPTAAGNGYVTGKAEWKNLKTGAFQSETTAQRLRNVSPVKINEIRFNTSDNPTNQFIELYNASSEEINISNWTFVNTPSGWASVQLATVPEGTKLAARGFYLLGLSNSGLAAPARKGDKVINVRSTEGMKAGQQINIGGEIHTIAGLGTPVTAATTLFIPVSTGPWLTFSAGTVVLPVADASGFVVGQKIGIEHDGLLEVATVTAVGKAATQTNLSTSAKAGETIIKVAANSNMSVGDTLTISTGKRKELVKIKKLIKIVEAPVRGAFGQAGPPREPGEVELESPLKYNHFADVDVSCKGTGISFSPATLFEHKSGDAVQALGSGITLTTSLTNNHETGSAILSHGVVSSGYQGMAKPNLWYGAPLSATAGSIALLDDNRSVVDAVVYGSQQSSSSANGTITSPELATLEGDQSQGGCIVVSPASGRFFLFSGNTKQENRSVGRFPDGSDTDSNCSDFFLQNTTNLLAAAVKGSYNVKVASVSGLSVGQQIIIGEGNGSETAVIAEVGTPGAAMVGTGINPGATAIPVAGVEGFSAGQSITIDDGKNLEKAVIASVVSSRRWFGRSDNTPSDTINVVSPLAIAHNLGAQISGSGITLASPLTKAHAKGAQVAGKVPTPGKPNQYQKPTF